MATSPNERGLTADLPNHGAAQRVRGAGVTRQIRAIHWKRWLPLLGGVLIFCLIYISSGWSDATEPGGKPFTLTQQGKASIALFCMITVWWVFEVVPIGVTGIAVGVLQTLFFIRPAKQAFGDFMDPAVWFIFGSLVIGLAFTKTGLTKRLAYRMLVIVGERTSMIYLGCFLLTASLTLFMAHTAVAATVFPLLMSIYSLYEDDSKPTRFGKGLFIGMAFTASAGSIITLFGSARGVMAVGFYKELVGREISFLQLTYYMFPLGLSLVIALWLFLTVRFRPEKKSIPGLRKRARALYDRLGPIKRAEWLAMVIVVVTVGVMALGSFIPVFATFNKSAVILVATLLFFLFGILNVDDLEGIPWNMILLFGGTMSIGYCLFETGAAQWLALKGLGMFQVAPGFWFVMCIAILVLMVTNLILNVAAIAITLPVAIVMTQYLNVSPTMVLFAALTTAGMPFLFLIGAAPNAIAYGSNQFTPLEFFKAGIPASIILLCVLSVFVLLVWPMMGMSIFAR